jgi:AcrR family transcriptional regulator
VRVSPVRYRWSNGRESTLKKTRKVGAEDSQRRAAILDATEQLILDEGYAAASTRQVAKKIGLAAGLIHYYFPTTDDLLIAVYRRAAEQTAQRLQDAIASARPLRALWKLSTDFECTALAMEFMAMANHRKAIRAEIARSSEQARRMQADALSNLNFGSETNTRSPLGLAVLIAGISRLLVMENSLGISLGHGEAKAFVKYWVNELEGEAKPATAGARSAKRPRKQRNVTASSRRP